MPSATDRTRSETQATQSPVLILAIDGANPRAPVARYGLNDVAEILIERGAERQVTRAAIDGTADGRQRLTLQVPDRWMSSNHAVIRIVDGVATMTDPGSKNRSFVNGVERRSARLGDGALLQLGHTFLVYRNALATPATPPRDRVIDTGKASALDTLLPALGADIASAMDAAAALRPIAIIGEGNCGRQRLARGIHERHRGSGPFVVASGAALDPGQILALLGQAGTGTLYLTDIDEIPTREHDALGCAMSEAADVLMIVAADRGDVPLLPQIASRIALPPLCERREDLGMLIGMHMHRVAKERPLGLSVDATYALLAYPWPGNLEELEQAIDHALADTDGDVITAGNLPTAIQAYLEDNADSADTADTVELSAQELAKRAELISMLQARKGNIGAVAKVIQESQDVVEGWIKRLNIDIKRFEG